ncbi:PBP1A family penicillin-binding protein [Deltaproteobacteria bacterium OttesenSCG-928-K17]|nr:PBP1A family penicillin-binding protein [Deltaproteobacteria bacterium OttesenSCG-928-K17]
MGENNLEITPEAKMPPADLTPQEKKEAARAGAKSRARRSAFQKDAARKAKKEPKAWVHPQAWVPREISFLFFIAPFFFWPVVLGLGILYVYSRDMADVPFDSLRDFNPPTVSYIYAGDGTTLAELFREHRLVVPLEKIPPVVIQAFLAAEDSNFYNHQGIDLLGLVRAFKANLEAGHTVQGASTITQQMIRTFLLSNEKTYDRKIREIVLSWRVERSFSKDDILYLYLNRIYLGRGAYGVESAAQLYYGKSIDQVSLAEASMLAGLVKAPGRLAPHLGTASSKGRQNYVLSRMVEVGYITEEQRNEAYATELHYVESLPNLYREKSPQFTEVVRRQAIEFLGEDELLTNGYRVYSTIDMKAQEMARDAVRNGLDALARRQRMSPRVARLNQVQAMEYNRDQREKMKFRPMLPGQEVAALAVRVENGPKGPGLVVAIGEEEGFLPQEAAKWILGGRSLGQYFSPDDLVMVRAVDKDKTTGRWNLVTAPPPDLQGGLVLMENKTGRILAIIGGRDFGQSQFNRAIQARRQPGSAFKPIVYTAAIDNGYTEASIIYDTPVSYPQGAGMPPWRPKNYSGRHSGAVTVYDAIRSSLNIPAVKVTEVVGPKVVAEYARKMGIKSPMVERLPLGLGASEVTLLELTQAYSTFPNQGSWCWPIFIDRVEDRNGELVRKFEPYLTRAISPQTAYIMVDMLVGVTSRGTAARVGAAFKGVPIGGKTGTTNSQADALFVGFTPEYTCGVWVGRDLRISLGHGEQGGRSAAPIFIEFMQAFLKGKDPGRFEVPEGVVRKNLSDMSGEDVLAMSGRSFVFKVGEVGRGRIDRRPADSLDDGGLLGATDAAGRRRPNYSTMSQQELDRRLLDYLKDYERRRDGGR